MNTIAAVAARARGPIRVVVVAAVLMAAVGVGVVFAANPMNHRQPILGSAAVTSTPRAQPAAPPSPTGVPSTAPAGAPTAAPSTPAGNLAAFACVSSTPITSGQGSPLIDAVRTGTHGGYDRLTIAFQDAPPGSIAISTQSGTTFTRSPRGDQVTLAGRNGIVINLFSTDAHTAYSGSTDIKTGYATLLEVRQVQDFEGYVTYGLGISGPACYRAFMLTNPSRLVVDIQAP